MLGNKTFGAGAPIPVEATPRSLAVCEELIKSQFQSQITTLRVKLPNCFVLSSFLTQAVGWSLSAASLFLSHTFPALRFEM